MDNRYHEKIQLSTSDLDALKLIYPAIVGELEWIRSTAVRVLFWASSLTFVIVGWIVSNENVDSWQQRLALTLMVLGFLCVVSFLIGHLKRYFLSAATAINRAERAMNAFVIGAYLPDEPLLPNEWMVFGKTDWKEPIFQVAQPIIGILGLISIAAIWLAFL